MGGCVGSPSRQITRSALVHSIQRVKLACQNTQIKKEKELQNSEQLLITEFKKDTASRNLKTEKAMINRTVYAYNIIQIYLIVENEAKKIIDKKQCLQDWEHFQNILPSARVISYCVSILNDENVTEFNKLVRAKYEAYSAPTEDMITNTLIRFHKNTEQVSFQMQNTFMLEFSQKHGISMEDINKVGHNYRYRAGTVSYSQS